MNRLTCKFCYKYCLEYGPPDAYTEVFGCKDCLVYFYFKNDEYDYCALTALIGDQVYDVYNYIDHIEVWTFYPNKKILSIDCKIELTPTNINDKLKLWMTFS
jgi:hypothetical protein